MLPTGSAVFADVEHYKAAVAAGTAALKPCHILVTKPYLQMVKEQLKKQPRLKDCRRIYLRSVKLLANFFGPEGAELRTVSTQRALYGGVPSDLVDI